jgi:hypothetical protein
MDTTAQTSKPVTNQRANLILWGCVVFSVTYTALIYALGPLLADVRNQLLPDQGAAWYYWKLPEPTLWSRATAWGLYLIHQFAVWGTIYYAQTSVKRYSNGLHPINYVALGINAFFAFVHVLQTHLWYDGLAQDVSIFSSQGSVIVLLVWVLLMENSRRGMFFGYKLPMRQNISQFARKYHGYFFAWAVVYTFWYHPTETTNGHLWGFFYTTLLLLQGSLFFTRAHVNKYWTFFLEFTVLVHGTLVAVQQGNGIWPMFLFGFGGIFIITQMHGLGLSRLARGGLLTAYIAGALFIYNSRGWDKLNEIIRIPIIDYLAVLILAGLFWLGLWITSLFRRKNLPTASH